MSDTDYHFHTEETWKAHNNRQHLGWCSLCGDELTPTETAFCPRCSQAHLVSETATSWYCDNCEMRFDV